MKKHAGVGVLIRKDRNISASDPDFNDPRIIGLDIEVYGFRFSLLTHIHPLMLIDPTTRRMSFTENSKRQLHAKGKDTKLVVVGDFNAQISIVYFDGIIVVEDSRCNDNGSRLKAFCRSKQLCMAQTYFDHPSEQRYT